MCAIAGSLLGDPLPRWEDTGVPSSGALDSINNAINTHSKYWRCLTSLTPKEDPKSHSLKEKIEDGASGSAALVKPLVGATGGGGGGKELAEMDRKIMEDNEKFGVRNCFIQCILEGNIYSAYMFVGCVQFSC